MAETKIIGGEFEIEVKQHYENIHHLPTNVVTFSSGRSALYNILTFVKAHLGITTILFPDYLCESVYQMAYKNQLKIEFYALDEQLSPDFNALESCYDTSKAVILINYFGLIDYNVIINHLRAINRDMIIILDNVQAPYAMTDDNDADFVFSSFRKAFPVSDGAWVISKKGMLCQPNKINDFAQYKIAASYLKSLRAHRLFCDEIYLDLFHKGEVKIDDDYQTDMTTLSKEILSDMDWQVYAKLRRHNAEVIVDGLKKLGIVPIIPLQKTAVPLFVPIRIDNRDRVRKAMFANNIFLPVHWPVEDRFKLELKRGLDLSVHELSIIVDQRYTESDMKHILNVLEDSI